MFQKGLLYQEGDRVFGWYRSDQSQAVELPIILDSFSYDDGIDVHYVKYIKVVEQEMGFCPAVSLPYKTNHLGKELIVEILIDGDSDFLELWEYGFASPCPLQWNWFSPGRDRWDDRQGYIVERSIIRHGFWEAWKWWPGCWTWYYEKRPELFEDAEWWGGK
jgi:hypothetical protein